MQRVLGLLALALVLFWIIDSPATAAATVTSILTILAGFAAQDEYAGKFKVVGNPFSEENYGIGMKKDDTELCTQISDAVKKMESDGAWKAAWDKNLGPAGLAAPAPPALNPC